MNKHSFSRVSVALLVLALMTGATARGVEEVYDTDNFDYSGIETLWDALLGEGAGAEYRRAYSTRPVFDIADKPANKGTLDYLLGRELWMNVTKKLNEDSDSDRWGSIFSLRKVKSGSDVDLSDIGENMLLNYDITETTLWCDRETGTIYNEKREGMDDIEIKVKNLLPVLYSFKLKKTLFGDEKTAKIGDDGKPEMHYLEEFDYVIGNLPNTIGHYVPNDTIGKTTAEKNPAPADGIIRGVYYNIQNSGAGGAIRNEGNKNILAIRADFYDCESPDGHGGGAISNFNYNTISGGIYGTFMNNSARQEGGAIWNWESNEISVIDGDFIGNHIGDYVLPELRGGAIYNYQYSKIGTITGNFIGNTIYSGSGSYKNGGDGSAGGAAIANGTYAHINMIVADFIGNSIMAKLGDGHGAGIYNGGLATINYIIGDFIGNSIDMPDARKGLTVTDSVYGHGAAICNMGMSQGDDRGGAFIYNIDGSFVSNYVRVTNGAVGGAIYNNRGGYIGSIRADFVGNYAESTWKKGEYPSDQQPRASGGAIVNFFRSTAPQGGMRSHIDEIVGNFYGNYAKAAAGDADGGAIGNWSGESYIGTITGNFIGNYAKSVNGIARGGAIYTDSESTINEISGSFYDNYAWSDEGYARGGAIANGGALNVIRNAIFENNYAVGNPNVGNVNGGAIYNKGTLEILADGAASLFRGNYIADLGEDGQLTNIRNEAIYGSGGSVISFVAINDGAVVVDDIITGDRNGEDGSRDSSGKLLYGHTLLLKGWDDANPAPDTSGVVVFNNRVSYADIYLENLSLVIHSEPMAESDLDKTLSSTYTSEEWRQAVLSEVNGKAGQYNRSTVLRESPLFATSGQVVLADGQITDYIFSVLDVVGPEDLLKDADVSVEEARNSGKLDEILTKREYATFSVDVDLDRGVADLITVFGITSDGGITWLQTPNRDEDRKSVSQGHVALNMSFLIDNNSYELENSYIPKDDITIQVINFVMMEGEQNGIYPKTDGDDDPYKPLRENPAYYENIIQLSDFFRHSKHARSYMNSSDIVADNAVLDTTKTYHDSITIQGYRDPLAAWAELREDETSVEREPDFNPWAESTHAEKVFEILSGGVRLTRDIVDTASEGKEKSPTMAGRDLTIKGNSLAEDICTLYVDNHNLLQEIGAEQMVRLQHFSLKGVNADTQITNNGHLILDTMSMEDSLVVYNHADGSDEGKKLVVTGDDKTQLNFTITTKDGTRGKMIIDNSSEVAKERDGRTVVTITGKVQNQDISIRVTDEEQVYRATRNAPDMPGYSGTGNLASGEGLTSDDLNDDYFKTVTNLITTDAFGNPTQAFIDFSDGATNTLDVTSGTKFNLGEMGVNRLKLMDFQVNGGVVYVASSTVNLKSKTMGGIDADTASTNDTGIIWLNKMKIKGDGGIVTHVKFVPDAVGNRVKDNGLRNKRVNGDIYEYYVTFADDKLKDEKGQTGTPGSYTFVRTGRVNPSIQAGAVAVQAGMVSMMNLFDYSFQHTSLYADAIAAATATAPQDFIVITPVKGVEMNAYTAAAAAADGQNAAAFPRNPVGAKGGMWVRPYATFENLPLRGGPKVDTTTYGALVGFDTDMTTYTNGWSSVFSAYLGYNGGRYKWDNNRTTSNGAVVGITESFYKGNFYAALTAAVGFSFGDTKTGYGSEDFRMISAGVAAVAGYSIAMDEAAKYVFQPSLKVAYTIHSVNDFKNGAGVDVTSAPTQGFQINPFAKFIAHTDSGWDPYLIGGFVWTLGGKSDFKANGDHLPGLSLRPYAEYGVGVQKTWAETYTFFGQLTGHSFGRQGFELTAGLRWAW